MPNLLNLPFKPASQVQLRCALRGYIVSSHSETHPDAFKWDIDKWESMRKEAASTVVHVDTVDQLMAYHAQLVFILTKLPPDINLSFSYERAFPTIMTPSPLGLSNLHYERVNILYNLATLHCHLANSEDRTKNPGIKKALTSFKNAAGALSYLISTALPPFEASLSSNTSLPFDLSSSFLKALQLLMLAQAQECFWQSAANGDVKNMLVAKLAAKTANLYKETLDMIDSDRIVKSFPQSWIVHIRTKHHHFAAAALYRKSVDDMENNRYGDELARLDMARMEARKAVEASRKADIAKTVQDDAKSLLAFVESNFKRAERDNDLIYHQNVPSATSLPKIGDIKDVVHSTVPLGLEDPKAYLNGGVMIFSELSAWGVRVAVDIYAERKKDWVQFEIFDKARQLDSEAASTLQALHLPAALEALDRPIGVPPSLLGKAEEVRSEDGMHRVPAMLEDIQKMARRTIAAIDEAFDILDQEATEDEEMRQSYSAEIWTRPASHEANKELVEQANRYRDILERAMQTDRETSEEWDQWSDKIAMLCWDEANIERSIPSSTISASSSNGGSRSTQGHARALRSYLEALEDIKLARSDLIHRVERCIETDDVTPRFMREAASVARWAEVRPEIFEEAMEEELNKYEKYRIDLEENQRLQGQALEGIRERNMLFLESRKEDPSVKAREFALQELDLAYHHYRDICLHLTDGMKFYNDLGKLTAQMTDTFKEWVLTRKKDILWLAERLNAMSLTPPPPLLMPVPQPATSSPPPPPQTPPTPAPEPERKRRSQRRAQGDVARLQPSALDDGETHSPAQSTFKPAYEMPNEPKSTEQNSQQDDLALTLPPPNSSAWESIMPHTLNLPPPDSSAWESIVPAGGPVSRSKKQKQGQGRKAI